MGTTAMKQWGDTKKEARVLVAFQCLNSHFKPGSKLACLPPQPPSLAIKTAI